MIEGDDDLMLLRRDLVQISELVMKIYEELRRGSEDADRFANVITPYRLVATLTERIREYPNLESPGEIHSGGVDVLATHLKGCLSNLDRYHRAARVVGIVEGARRGNILREEVERLKALLDIEEIDVVQGEELQNYKDLNLEVASSEGDGVRTVISEVVERGYKSRTTGAVLKQPRVRVIFLD